MSEGRILSCDIFPQRPYTTGTDLCITVWCVVLVTVDRALCTASVSDENIIILCKKDTLLHIFYLAFDSSGDLFAILEIKDHVCDLSIKLEVNTCILQIFFHGKDQGFVLVVLGEFQGAEIRKTCNVVDKTLEVKLHLQSTVPVFKCEHGSPVQPEGGIKHFIIEYIFDGFIVKILILCHKKLHDLHTAFLAQVKFSVSMCILSTIDGCTAERIVRIVLVQPVELVQNRSTRFFKRRNTAEKIPQALEMVFHLTTATHDISSGRIKDSIAGTAGNIHGFQDVDMITWHLCVSYQEACSSQGSKTASYNVGMLVVHTFRFFRTGKGFVVTVGIINPFAVFVMLSTLGVAVVCSSFFHMEVFLFVDLSCFFHQHGCAGSGCRKCCKTHESFFI